MKLTSEQIREAWDTWHRVIEEKYHPLEISYISVGMDKRALEVGFCIEVYPTVREGVPEGRTDEDLIYEKPYLAVVKGLKGEEAWNALGDYVDAHPELLHLPGTVRITEKMVEARNGLFTVEELLALKPKPQ